MTTTNAELIAAVRKLASERMAKAVAENERARSLRIVRTADEDRRKADMADEHAWALRNQADGIYEAANLLAALTEGERR